jgi:hypothetical protein
MESLLAKMINYKDAKAAHKASRQALNAALKQIGSPKKTGEHAYHAFLVHHRTNTVLTKKQKEVLSTANLS